MAIAKLLAEHCGLAGSDRLVKARADEVSFYYCCCYCIIVVWLGRTNWSKQELTRWYFCCYCLYCVLLLLLCCCIIVILSLLLSNHLLCWYCGLTGLNNLVKARADLALRCDIIVLFDESFEMVKWPVHRLHLCP